MKGSFFVLVVLAIATINAQPVANNNTCLAANVLTPYNLVSQSAAISNNGTCTNFHSTAGACATPGSVANAMTVHNNWLAMKAQDAQNYALQYINATVYWQTQNKVINATTPAPSNNNPSNWWNNLTNTLTNWWSKISNRATGLFKNASQWIQNVFNNNVSNIPNCLNAWGNITNGAFCLSSSASSFMWSTNDARCPGDLSLGVDLNSTGNALNNCASLMDTYCQLTWGISIKNTTAPFNQTFSWGDNGLSNAWCQSMQSAVVCGNACQSNVYTLLVEAFRSHWLRFVPSAQATANLGTFLNTTNAPNTFVPVQAAAGAKSMCLFATTTSPANLVTIGSRSGQPSRKYETSSVARFFGLLVSALFALMF